VGGHAYACAWQWSLCHKERFGTCIPAPRVEGWALMIVYGVSIVSAASRL
jgi:hypothetical protein